jgi:CheY-like chemotaxis protein
LGGEIRLHSVPGVGSTFTLYLPERYAAPIAVRGATDGRGAAARSVVSAAESMVAVTRAKPTLVARAEDDDRENIAAGDRVLLVVDDDSTYSRIVLDAAHERGYKVLVAARGDMGLAMARKFRPHAVLLDIGLPDTTGWSVLDQLQHDPDLHHVPIHVLSIYEDRRRGLELGAASYSRKVEGREVLESVFDRVSDSLERRDRAALVINAGGGAKAAISEALELDGIRVIFAESVAAGIDGFKMGASDCVILVAGTDGVAADALLELQKTGDRNVAVIAYAPEGVGLQELDLVPMREGTVVRKAPSPDRLLAEVTRILHVPETSLPEHKRLKLEKLRQIDDELAGRRVLIVDDDVRNIFALTSILERHNIQVLHAENGRAGIDALLQTPDIDLVLMDIMMPGMDGYETIRAIRELEQLRSLPIIAVTAKAMKGDREKCIDSGASDYIAKPVDLDQLFSLMRVWVHDRSRTVAGARTAV